MAARFVISGGDGCKTLVAIAVETVVAICKQACAKGEKNLTKLLFDENVGKVERREMYHDKLDALLVRVAVDASEGGVAVSACNEANGNSGETGDLTEIVAAGQSVRLNIPGEICESNVTDALWAVVLREKAAANGESGNTVEEAIRLSGGGYFVQKVREIDHLLIRHGAPSFLVERWANQFWAKSAQPVSESSTVWLMAL